MSCTVRPLRFDPNGLHGPLERLIVSHDEKRAARAEKGARQRAVVIGSRAKVLASKEWMFATWFGKRAGAPVGASGRCPAL